MAAGKEIKRLRGSISAEKAAALIGVSSARLRKWEERDADPKDTGDIQALESYFGCSLQDLTKLEKFKWEDKKNPDPVTDQDFKDKYIALLEVRNKELQERLHIVQSTAERISSIEAMLTEIRGDMNVMAALQTGYQEYWAEHYPPKSVKSQDVLRSIHTKAASRLLKIEKEGIRL